MIIYQSNSGLCYNQFAYLIKIGEGNHPRETRYLCIGSNYTSQYNDCYNIGEPVDLEGFEVERSSKYKLTDSPLYGSFLFTNYINSLKDK